MGQTKTKPVKAASPEKAASSAAKKNSSASRKAPDGSAWPMLSDSAHTRLLQDAQQLEKALEEALLKDAIYSAKRALEELAAETRNLPHERRSGMRLREKALRVENAFNRLRALRRGELLPPRLPDE